MALGCVTNEALLVGEGNVGGRSAVTMVVGDDLNTTVLPNCDTAIGELTLLRSKSVG